MASKDADKGKDKDKAKHKAQPQGDGKQQKAEAKAAKDKEKAKKAKEGGEAAPKEAKEEKPKAAPRPPADPRLKFLKKFHGKFLPRGPLRDRLKALMDPLGLRRGSRRRHRRRAQVAVQRLESRPREAGQEEGDRLTSVQDPSRPISLLPEKVEAADGPTAGRATLTRPPATLSPREARKSVPRERMRFGPARGACESSCRSPAPASWRRARAIPCSSRAACDRWPRARRP